MPSKIGPHAARMNAEPGLDVEAREVGSQRFQRRLRMLHKGHVRRATAQSFQTYGTRPGIQVEKMRALDAAEPAR